MEGKNGGKRLAVEPNNNGKKRTAILIAAIAVALLVGGYTALCAYAGGNGGRLAPNARIGGVEVGGLSAPEAVSVLDTALGQRLSALEVPFACGEGLYNLPGADFSYDAQALVDSLSPASVPFPARGFKFLAGMLDRNGSPVTLTLDHTPAEVDRAAREQGDADSQTTWDFRDTAIVFTKGRTGRTVDIAELLGKLTERADHLLNNDEPADYAPVEAPIIIAPSADPDFEAIRREVYAEVSEAYLDRETMEIVPSVTGKDLDAAAAKAALDRAEEGQTFRVELTLTEPAVSTEALTESLFRDVLGEATTRVTGTSIRKGNVGVAAAFVNSTVLFPGEEFSFNQKCSPYTVENGYGKATAYVNGLSKDTVAGGICQVSSTLYWAVLKANLEVLDRRAHGYEPSYVKGGLDATVFGNYGEKGSTDFRFKNNSDHPLRITAELDSKNYLTVTITGTDSSGIHGEPYSANRVVTKAYQTIYQADATVPQGTTRKDPERTGYNGVSIDTYQKLVDRDGNVISETKLYTTKYSCRDEIIFFHPDDLALWNIDPFTGIRTEPTAAPGETVPGGEEGVPPQEGETPAPPPETGTAPSPGPEEPILPGESQEPLLPQLTPPPEPETPDPVPSPDTQPVLPPGTILTS